MTRPNTALPEDVVLAATTPDGVVASAGREPRTFRRGDPSGDADFAAFVGAERVVVCDSAPALAAALAGERPGPAAQVWRLLDRRQISDVRMAHGVLARLTALAPRPRSFADLSRRFASDVPDPVGRLRAVAEAFFGGLPDEVLPHARSPQDRLGVGHATRAAVAVAIADRRAAERLWPGLMNLVKTHQSSSKIPRHDHRKAVDLFLAERFSTLLDESAMRFPLPADEKGRLSRDLRDWGPLADADPLLHQARAAWAVERLAEAKTASPQDHVPGIPPRSRLDYGGLRRRFAPLIRPAADEALLLVKLNHLASRCLVAASAGKVRLIPPWFTDSLREPGGPAARLADGVAGTETQKALSEPGLAKLPRERRIEIIGHILDALVAGFGEGATNAYVRNLAGASDVPAHSIGRLRKGIAWDTLISVENYGDEELGRRLAEMRESAEPAHPFDVVSLGLELVGDLIDPETTDRRRGKTLKRFLFGTHRELPRDADEVWGWVTERIGRTDPAAMSEETAGRIRLATRESLSERPIGLCGVLPKVPFWQAPPIATGLAAEEIRGVVAFALARFDCGLVALDADEFVVSVPEVRAESTGKKIPVIVEHAIASLVGDDEGSGGIAAGCCSVEPVGGW